MTDEINHNDDSLGGALNISPERQVELCTWLEEFIRPLPQMSSGLELIRQEPTYTEEETIYLYFQTGYADGKTQGHLECIRDLITALMKTNSEGGQHDE